MKNMVSNRAIVCFLLAVLAAGIRPVEGIEFDLVFQTKCVYEEIIFEFVGILGKNTQLIIA